MKNTLFNLFMVIALVLVVVSQTGCTSTQPVVRTLVQDVVESGCDIASAQRRGSFEKVRCK